MRALISFWFGVDVDSYHLLLKKYRYYFCKWLGPWNCSSKHRR